MDSKNDLILRLEKLANLQLSPTERVKMAANLDKMISMISSMADLDTEGVEPLVYLSEPALSLREDEEQEPSDANNLVEAAPKLEGPYFVVPKVSSKPAE